MYKVFFDLFYFDWHKITLKLQCWTLTCQWMSVTCLLIFIQLMLLRGWKLMLPINILMFSLTNNLFLHNATQQLVNKLKLLGLHFRHTVWFSSETRKRLVAPIFLPVLDYGALLCMNVAAQCLNMSFGLKLITMLITPE